MGLLALFALSPSWLEPKGATSIRRKPLPVPKRAALFEKMPQRDAQPSDGDQCDGNNRQIEPAHLFLIRLRPTDLLVTC